jgi:putative ABC transport system permease protein
MLKNFIIIALRNFKRSKFYSFINIFGLAIGIATAILSLLYVGYELSYDRFHEKSDRIYRIAVDALAGNTIIKQTFNPAPMPEALYNEYSEIEAVTRVADWGTCKIEFGNKVFNETEVLAVDTTFFDIFSLEFVIGQADPKLLGPNMVVLSEKTAHKYFGDENPVGKMFVLDDETNLQVSAVVRDFPANSHFHFSMLASLLSFDGYYNNSGWFNNNYRIYILLDKNQDYKILEDKFPDFVNKYHYGGDYNERSNKESNKWELYLQPLTNIHLNSHLSGEFEANGNAAYIYIFGVVGIFILLIACINFINMATAKSSSRAREISIRKVVGSSRGFLIRQFMIESLIISFISLFVALVLVELALLYLPDLIDLRLEIPWSLKLNLIPGLAGLVLLVGLISGTYPALVLSALKPVSIFKNQMFRGKKGAWLRNALVIFQFTISIILIVGTFVISRQLDFVQNEQLGFEKEQVVIVKNISMIGERVHVLKNKMLEIPAVQSASFSNRLPGLRFANIGFGAEGFDGGFTLNLCMNDPDFQNVLKFNMVEGRYFSKEFGTDTSGIVLNQAAVKLIGWENPIGKKVNTWGRKPFNLHVIGVVEDLHYESMHTEIRPMAFLHIDSPFHWSKQYMAVRISTGNLSQTLEQMAQVWTDVYPQLPIEFSFFNEDYDKLYVNEVKTKKLFILFSLLAVFIACLGLLGLAAFMVERRTREIGVRKVLGASVSGLVVLLSGQFTKWVIVANLIAWPLAWYVMKLWLENFAYRVGFELWFFALAGLIALMIALVTVSSQVIKVALSNPVDSLRYE